MDEASQGLLRRILELVSTRPLLVCLTRRETGSGFIADPASNVRSLQPVPMVARDFDGGTQLAHQRTPFCPMRSRAWQNAPAGTHSSWRSSARTSRRRIHGFPS